MNTCLKLNGGAGIAAAVFVDSSDVEGVVRRTFQIWDVTGRGGGSAAGVVTSDPFAQREVAEGSFCGVPRHPGRVGYAVQTALDVPGHTWSCGGGR